MHNTFIKKLERCLRDENSFYNIVKRNKMTRNEYLKEVFEACSYFWLEMADVKRHYQLMETTEKTISVFITHQDEEEAYIEVLHYDDDEHLIDDLISDL